jgi:ribose-phosphate pyrophosphokinase
MQALSAEVANHLGISLGQIRIKRFADGEIYVQVQESIRGCDVFLIQPTCPTETASVNDMLIELMVMVDACKYVAAFLGTGMLSACRLFATVQFT